MSIVCQASTLRRHNDHSESCRAFPERQQGPIVFTRLPLTKRLFRRPTLNQYGSGQGRCSFEQLAATPHDCAAAFEQLPPRLCPIGLKSDIIHYFLNFNDDYNLAIHHFALFVSATVRGVGVRQCRC